MLTFLFLLASWVVSEEEEVGQAGPTILQDEVSEVEEVGQAGLAFPEEKVSDEEEVEQAGLAFSQEKVTEEEEVGQAGLAFLQENAQKEGVITLASGLQYKVLIEGTGKYRPAIDSSCECHYKGTRIDGTVFDSSYSRAKPTTLTPGQLIKGWKEALQLMVEGDKWILYIPSELGYGDKGFRPIIPAKSVLIFEIELVKINGDKVAAVRCNPFTHNDCNEREKKWLSKLAEKFKGNNEREQYQKELERLSMMAASKMLPKLKEWLNIRINLLSQYLKGEGDSAVTKEEL